MADRRTCNVVILGLGFLFIFTAFTTCGNVEVSSLWSRKPIIVLLQTVFPLSLIIICFIIV